MDLRSHQSGLLTFSVLISITIYASTNEKDRAFGCPALREIWVDSKVYKQIISLGLWLTV